MSIKQSPFLLCSDIPFTMKERISQEIELYTQSLQEMDTFYNNNMVKHPSKLKDFILIKTQLLEEYNETAKTALEENDYKTQILVLTELQEMNRTLA